MATSSALFQLSSSCMCDYVYLYVYDYVYLQLPEPIMPFRLYNTLMGLAKESTQQGEGGEAGKGPEMVDRGPQTEPEVVALVEKLQALMLELPPPNVATLRYITRHLRRY